MVDTLRILMVVNTRCAYNGTTCYAAEHIAHLPHGCCDLAVHNEPPAGIRAQVEAAGGRVFVLPGRNRRPLSYLRALTRLVRDNGYDAVHAHGNSCTLLVEMAGARRGGAKVRIAHAHSTTCNQKLLHRLLRGAFDASYTHAAACGQLAGEFLFAGKPFTVLQNGIDTAACRFDPAARERLRAQLGVDGCFLIGHVGAFTENKRQAFLVDLLAQLPARADGRTYRLVLVGDGETADAVRARAAEAGVSERVLFLGRRTDVPELLSAFDLFALPSLREGMPLSAAEAQCAGLPCLISDTVTREAGILPETRFLPPADLAKWTAAVGACAQKSDAARAASADAVRAAGFDLADTADTLYRTYERWAGRA